MLKNLLRFCIALTLVFIGTIAAADPIFSNMFFFGDSLTDTGNNLAPPQPAPITSPGGSTWAFYFAQQFGFLAIPSNYGGNNYAYAGAQTGPSIINGFPNSGVAGQVSDFLATHQVDPHALYSVWAGANDFNLGVANSIRTFVARYAVLNGGMLPSSTQIGSFAASIAPGVVTNAVNSIDNMVNELHTAGARYIMVPNLPNLGLTPNGAASSLASLLTKGSLSFNQLLNIELNGNHFDIIQTDISSLFNDVLANPAMFGFTNVSQPCLNTATGTVCSNPNSYLSWDGTHPSALAQQEIADYDTSIIEGPTRIANLAVAPFSIMDAQNAQVENQIYAVRTGMVNLPCGETNFFAGGGYTSFSQDAQGQTGPGFDGNTTNISIGGIHRINSYFTLGASLAHSFGDVNFGHTTGDFELYETMGSVFGNFMAHHFYADGIVNYGVINYDDVTRNVPIGPSVSQTTGNTYGTQFGADLIAGYNIADCNFKTGPIVDVDYQHIHVNSYGETGTINGIAENFDSQGNDSTVTGAGWQASYIFCLTNYQIMPFAQMTYNHQWENSDRNIGAGLVSLPGSHFNIPVTVGPNSDFGVINAGISMLVHQTVNITAGYQGTVFYSGANTQNIGASVQVSL